MVRPTMFGKIVLRRDQVLITLFSPDATTAATFLARCSSINAPYTITSRFFF